MGSYHICFIVRKQNKNDYSIFQMQNEMLRHKTCLNTTITPADPLDLAHMPALKEISK